jgi:Glycosyl transferase family group 2
MYESPEVALLQHASGIMQVTNSVFENGITYFTNLVYTSIQFAVGSGDCAPFVGHNTFIRWKAIQSIASYDEEVKRTLFWSESHVSEDFDVSLRLQMNGFVVRLATYHDGGFEEGVSLTVYDELARWEKYAYGCNELVFNPLRKWPTSGPFTKIFWRFCGSNIKITSKLTIFAYIFTYYAIASAVPLALANYCIVGWFGEFVDQFYIASWKIFVGMAVIFNIVSPLAYSMLRHRLGHETFFISLWEAIKWMPMFLLFFGGLSYHLSKAILCHFFSINIEWTATAKELEDHGLRAGLDRIVRDFKGMYMVMLPLAGGMIYLAVYAHRGWQIKDFTAIVPLANQVGCHALLPVSIYHRLLF